MASNGIKDRVAIVGMGCTPFGEHWDKGPEDLLVDAADGGLPLGGHRSRRRSTPTGSARWAAASPGLMLSEALKLPYKPVTRLENMCATGSEAIRNAAYARRERRLRPRDGDRRREAEGLGLLRARRQPARRTTAPLSNMTAPATFSLLAPAYAKKYGVDEGELKQVLARIAWKNHKNGAKNPKAQFRKEVPMETICKSPSVAGMLGIFDCSGVSDGSAAAILCRAEDAHKYTKHPIFIKALVVRRGSGGGLLQPGLRLHDLPRGRRQLRATPTSRRASPQRRAHVRVIVGRRAPYLQVDVLRGFLAVPGIAQYAGHQTEHPGAGQVIEGGKRVDIPLGHLAQQRCQIGGHER